MRALGLFLLIVSITCSAQAARMAVLQGLNKVTAKTEVLEVVLGSPVRFGTLQITPRACWNEGKSGGTEAAALLEIEDRPPGEDTIFLFSGWMFASSPSLSAIEHPVYDMRMLRCKEAK